MTNSAGSPWLRSRRNEAKARSAIERPNKKRDLFLAFIVVSLPLLAVALTLLAFVFKPSERQQQDPSFETNELPFWPDQSPLSGFYYTRTGVGNFLLLSSWAGNIAFIVVAPFMVLFSYAVAREMVQHSSKDPDVFSAQSPLLHEIMRGTFGVYFLA